jgi:hypothetical protein
VCQKCRLSSKDCQKSLPAEYPCFARNFIFIQSHISLQLSPLEAINVSTVLPRSASNVAPTHTRFPSIQNHLIADTNAQISRSQHPPDEHESKLHPAQLTVGHKSFARHHWNVFGSNGTSSPKRELNEVLTPKIMHNAQEIDRNLHVDYQGFVAAAGGFRESTNWAIMQRVVSFWK